MIKINLLPYREEQKKDLVIQQVIIGAIPLLISIFIIGFFWWSTKSEIASAENKIAELKIEIKKQENTLKKIDAFKKKKKTLTKKMDVIKTLQNGKSGPVHMLDDLAVNLPGRLWLTSLKQKNMQVEISGKSLDNISISNYMTNIEKSPYFNKVDLKQIKTETKLGPKGIQLKNFVITTNTSYTTKQKP